MATAYRVSVRFLSRRTTDCKTASVNGKGDPPYRRLLLQWHITERCNLRCAHCYQEGAAGAELSLPELIGILGQFKTLLDQVEARWGVPTTGHINVTGGEPFIRPDFPDLLKAMAAEKPRITFGVLTNGTFIDGKTAKALSKLGPTAVQVSIEGTEATHDRIRGAGNLRRTVAAVRNLVRHEVPASISFTAHRLNYREFPEVARLGRKLHALRVWSDRHIPIGNGCGFETLTPEEARELFGLMRTARLEAEAAWFGKTKISMIRALQFMAGGRPYQCKAGDALITILPNGDLVPCRRMPIHVGNVLTDGLSKLYFESEILLGLRDRTRVSEGCEACKFERHCRGGLRCLSYAVNGTPFRADPGCWLASRTACTEAGSAEPGDAADTRIAGGGQVAHQGAAQPGQHG